MEKSDIGLIGLAVMGENLALNIESKGYRVSLYNRLHPHTPQAVDRFLASVGEGRNFRPTYSLDQLVESLKRPRKILLMIRAGEPVDEMITALLPLLAQGDIIIDGGNSDYRDTRRRQKALSEKGIYLVGCGISGGEEGALHGPSIMPGGDEAVAGEVLPLLQAIAAHLDDGTPCCSWIGPDGSGHLVKTVHNGIEYGDMQLIAESYSLLKIKRKNNHDEMARTFEAWNRGVLESYLIGITAPILHHREEDGGYLIDRIADRARQKGTGKWCIEAALDSATPLGVTTQAVFARFLSAREQERTRAHRLYPDADPAPILALGIDDLHHALYASKIMAYAQGFDLLYQPPRDCHRVPADRALRAPALQPLLSREDKPLSPLLATGGERRTLSRDSLAGHHGGTDGFRQLAMRQVAGQPHTGPTRLLRRPPVRTDRCPRRGTLPHRLVPTGTGRRLPPLLIYRFSP